MFYIYINHIGLLPDVAPVTEEFVDTSLAASGATAGTAATGMPQQTALVMYTNTFNMVTDDTQKTVIVSLDLLGYTKTNTLSEVMRFVLAANVTKQLNTADGAVRIVNVTYGDTAATATISVAYSSVQAALAAVNMIASQLVSTAMKTSLVSAGMSQLTDLSVSTAPRQGVALENQNNTYSSLTNQWIDFSRNTNANANNIGFTLVSSAALPGTLVSANGLPIKGIKMVGPPSTQFGNGYLDSFTAVWYMKINALEFTKNKIMIFQLFAETPNKIQLNIQPNGTDATTAVVEAIVGVATTKYQWTIPRTTLMSNGNTTLYSLVYNPTANKLNFYIGELEYPADVTLNPDYPIKLGLSQMIINDTPKFQSLDANILAFAYYNVALTNAELKALSVYFSKEAGGINLLQQMAQQEAARVLQLQKEIATTATSYTDLQKQLQECKASTPAPEKPAVQGDPKKWNIRAAQRAGEEDTISTKDLGQCSPLSLKKFGEKAPPTPEPSTRVVYPPPEETVRSSEIAMPKSFFERLFLA